MAKKDEFIRLLKHIQFEEQEMEERNNSPQLLPSTISSGVARSLQSIASTHSSDNSSKHYASSNVDELEDGAIDEDLFSPRGGGYVRASSFHGGVVNLGATFEDDVVDQSDKKKNPDKEEGEDETDNHKNETTVMYRKNPGGYGSPPPGDRRRGGRGRAFNGVETNYGYRGVNKSPLPKQKNSWTKTLENVDSSDDPPVDYGSSLKPPTAPKPAVSPKPSRTALLNPDSSPFVSFASGESQFPSRSSPSSNESNTEGYERDPLTLADLAKLPELTLKTITDTIEKRYNHDLIYTRCGEILISINPNKLVDLCTYKHYKAYTYESISHIPHLFAISAKAYQGVRNSKQNQVILVSGESGAGKTEATKLMVQHLMSVAGNENNDLQDKIIKVNPLLETFGNARTILNSNSSRFAKLLILNIREDGKIDSARIKDYMLEKSRVVHHSDRERTFHSFYALLMGASDGELAEFYIKKGDNFRIMGKPVADREREVYADFYRHEQEVFKLLKLTSSEIQDINTILAAILHIGNIEFEDWENDSVIIKNEDVVEIAAVLLHLDPEKLTKVLIERRGKMGKDGDTVHMLSRGDVTVNGSFSLLSRASRGDVIELSKNKKQAEDERDALCKTLYERLFGWLVMKINNSLKSKTYRNIASIGILDICGFENLEKNSFEQICINLVNEQLQNFMNKQVIEDEKDNYLREGVEIADVDATHINNDAILKMFMADRTGIMALIDENSKIGFSTDEGLVEKMKSQFRNNEHFIPSVSNGPTFNIRHFAGEVSYDARSFLEKNKDTLSDDMMLCMQSSNNTFIQDLFTVKESETGSISMAQFHFRGSKKVNEINPRQTPRPSAGNWSKSINASRKTHLEQKFGGRRPDFKSVDMAQRSTHIKYFKESMSDLLAAMRNAHPYFVRCIKPNDKLQPGAFVRERVMEQLRYNGVKEAARIRTFGFPIRLKKDEFEKTYKDLVDKQSSSDLIQSIFEFVNVEPAQFIIGKSQIFMKEQAYNAVENALTRLRCEQKRIREEAERRQKDEEERKKRAAQLQRELDNGVLNTIVEASSTSSIYNSVPGPSSGENSAGSVLRSLPGGNDNNDESSSEEEEESSLEADYDDSDNSTDKQLNAAWDITQELTEEEERQDVHEQPILMFIKFIVYILLFLIILGCLVIQKGALLLLLSNLGNRTAPTVKPKEFKTPAAWYKSMKDAQTAAFVFLEIAICLPYAVFWLITMGKLFFGNFSRPSVWTWIWVFIMECLHTVGLCLLIFKILPSVDVYRAAMLLCGTAMLPSILKLTVSNADYETRQRAWVECNSGGVTRKLLRVLFDILAMLGQVSVIPLIAIFNFLGKHPDIKDDHWRLVEMIGAFFLISFSHWENFCDGQLFCELSDTNWFKNAMLKIRYEMQAGRHYPHALTYLVKIGLSILVGYLLSGDVSLNYQEAFRSLSKVSELKTVSPIIAITVAGFVAFYAAFAACMFQMQIISLTLPIILSTPVVILLFYLDCVYNFLPAVTVIIPECPDAVFHKWYHIIFGVVWWISLLVLTRHMWQPQVDRTANMARIFLNPGYCGILTAESIMLNRRRNPCRINKEPKYDEHGEIKAKYYKLMSRKAVLKDEEELDEDNADVESTPNTAIHSEEGGGKKTEDYPATPMLYACATMWHEVKTEMVQLLKSLHRLDRDQYIRRMANERVKGFDPEFYNFEAHIFFDDAMELDDNNERVPNRWVKELVDSMSVACSSVHGKPMKVHPPTKVPTPYGGQLIWQMPGENLLFVHMKDMGKIRNRKRWSQVMYMYYLLGYRHIMASKNEVLEKMIQINRNRGNHGLNVTEINYLLGQAATVRSQNTFLLALDGDTDFSPGSIKILLDRMKDENVGAACGRIHPIGNGPMVWYQKFEYAIGHWLQKAAEHVFGCVLCSPGCFSLFRASALMDTNVMKKYTTEPTEATHHLQYDQGEDRWLCTLMLQQGYRIEYAAAADAWTFAPEGFFEFFNQRRRWMPSTIANILDLLASSSMTTKRNPNMSILYIGYTWLLMLMTILGPGTILMMIAGAVKLVFNITLIEAYLFATIPAAVFTVSCFWLDSKKQLIFAAMLSVFYTFIMMIVLVGTIYTATTENIFHPSVIVIVMLMGIFIVAGFCHPKEIWCLVHGVMYLLTIPSGYLLLVIYSIVNLNDVSWGTREVPTKAQKLEMDRKKKEKEEAKKNKKKKGIFARIFNRGEEHIRELTNLVKTLVPERAGAIQSQLVQNNPGLNDNQVIHLLSKIENNLELLLKKTGRRDSDCDILNSVIVDQPPTRQSEGQLQLQKSQKPETSPAASSKPPSVIEKKKKRKPRDELKNPFWAEDKEIGRGATIVGNKREMEFWKDFVKKYLEPIHPTAEEKKKLANDLRELRNNSSFALIIVNLLWMALNFMFQYTNAARFTISYSYGGEDHKIEESILGLSFVALLLLLLIIQMAGMFIHRMGTLQHLLAITEIRLGKSKKQNTGNEKRERDTVIKHIKAVLKLPSNDDAGVETKAPELAPRNNKFGVTFMGASTRRSFGQGPQQTVIDQIGRTMGKWGHVLAAKGSNNQLDRRTQKDLDSLRQRLTSGQASTKLKNILEKSDELGKSFRPLLPPRGRSKHLQPTMLQPSQWGFTHKELQKANISIANDDHFGTRDLGDLGAMGAMGRTLFQRTRIMDEGTMDDVNRDWNRRFSNHVQNSRPF